MLKFKRFYLIRHAHSYIVQSTIFAVQRLLSNFIAHSSWWLILSTTSRRQLKFVKNVNTQILNPENSKFSPARRTHRTHRTTSLKRANFTTATRIPQKAKRAEPSRLNPPIPAGENRERTVALSLAANRINQRHWRHPRKFENRGWEGGLGGGGGVVNDSGSQGVQD